MKFQANQEKFEHLEKYFEQAKAETRPKRLSFLASEMVAISLDNAKELRRIERLKR